jgi:hypothetical protein
MFYQSDKADFCNDIDRKQIKKLDCILQELMKIEGLPMKLFAKFVFPDLYF